METEDESRLAFQERCKRYLENSAYKKYGQLMMKMAKTDLDNLQFMSNLVIESDKPKRKISRETTTEMKLISSHTPATLLLQECLLYPADDNHFEDNDIFQTLAEKHKHLLLVKRKDDQRTVLHLAVAGGKHKAAKYILDKVGEMFDIENNRSEDENGSNKAFIDYMNSKLELKEVTNYNKTNQEERNKAKRYVNTCMGAEIPLLMAVWNLDVDMVKLLLDKDAPLTVCNSKHENVFHILVQVAGIKEDKDNTRIKSIKCIFNMLVNKIKEKKQKNTYKGKLELSRLLNKKNSESYTPLCLSAKLLAGEIYQMIVNEAYKDFDESHGACNEYFYDIEDFDSALGEESVMRIIACQNEDDYSDYQSFTNKSPLIDMIELKWNVYKWQFYTWGVVHLLFSIIPIVYFSLNESSGHLYNASNTTEPQKSLALDTSLVIYHIYGLLILVMELVAFVERLVNTCKKHIKYSFFARLNCCNVIYKINSFKYPEVWYIIRNSFSTAGNRSFEFLLLTFGFLSLASITMLSIGHEQSFIPLALCMVAGWSFLLQFLRCFRVFSYFTIMLYTALIKNLFQLAIVYSLFLLPFGAAMTAAYAGHKDENDFSTYGTCLFTLFHTSIGLADVTTFETAKYPELAAMIYTSHSITTYVLLFNILIALLSETAVSVSRATTIDSMWHLQKLNIILFIEDHLRIQNRFKCGIPKQTDFFPSEESKSSQQKEQISVTIDKKQKKRTRHYMEIREIIAPDMATPSK